MDEKDGYQSSNDKNIGNQPIGNIGNQKKWLTTKQFCELVGFENEKSGSRPLRNALKGKTWHSSSLEVQQVIGKKGGKSGKIYEVNLYSLPQEYIKKYWNQNGRQSPDLSEVKRGTVDLSDALSLEKRVNRVQNLPPDLSSLNGNQNETKKPSQSLVPLDDTVGNHTDTDIGNQSPKNPSTSLEPLVNRVTNRETEPEKWLTSAQIAELSGNNKTHISDILSEAFNRSKPWNEFQLEVVQSEGKGRGGKSYLAHIDSLPADIRLKWYKKTQPPDRKSVV